MQWWQAVLLAGVAFLAVLCLVAYFLWRTASARTRTLGQRLVRLPWRSRLRLAWLLARDGRVPLALRAVPPLLVVYLAMPLDIIPDFIPILGQIDDIVVVLLAVGLVARFVPLDVLESHLVALEDRLAM